MLATFMHVTLKKKKKVKRNRDTISCVDPASSASREAPLTKYLAPVLARNHEGRGSDSTGAAPRRADWQLWRDLVTTVVFVRRVWCDTKSKAGCLVISAGEFHTLKS